MNIKYMHSFFLDRNSLETHKLNFTSLSFACGPRVEYLKSSPRLLNFSTDLVICKIKILKLNQIKDSITSIYKVMF